MKRSIISILFVSLLAFAFVAADDLSGSMSSKSGDPGSSVTFDISYTNAGATAMTVSSTSSTLSDGTRTISGPSIGSVSVPAGGSASVSFTLTVPATAAGIYTGTITATDTTNAANIESLSYSLTVNSKDSFSLSTSTVNFDLQNGDESETFTITNDGSTSLTNFVVSFTSSDGDSGKILDNDDDELRMSFSGVGSSLSPGGSMTVTLTADQDSDMDFGTYTGTISVNATGNAAKSATLSVTAVMTADICEEGKQGNDFDIDIRNPDAGDDFLAGEVIPVEVKVENNANEDMDVELEAILYNMDTGDKEKVERVEGSIDEDETETFSFDFELPTGLDEDDDYELFVQVHEEGNEDDSCEYESVEIDLDRDDEGAVLQDVSISPSVGLACGDEYRVSVYVESTGAEEVNDLYVELQDADLEVQESSESFDLGDFDDSDNIEKLSFDLTLPRLLDVGSYSLEAILYSRSGSVLDSELVSVDVSSCTEEDSAGDLAVQVSEDYTVEGNELTLSLLITNTGESESMISVNAEEVSWATLTGTEYLESLQASDEAHAYLYFTLDETTLGKHDIKITVTDDKGNEISEIVTVDFGAGAETEEDDKGFFEGWSSESGSGGFWIIVDIILVILAVIFLRMLFSKK